MKHLPFLAGILGGLMLGACQTPSPTQAGGLAGDTFRQHIIGYGQVPNLVGNGGSLLGKLAPFYSGFNDGNKIILHINNIDSGNQTIHATLKVSNPIIHCQGEMATHGQLNAGLLQLTPDAPASTADACQVSVQFNESAKQAQIYEASCGVWHEAGCHFNSNGEPLQAGAN